MKIIILLLVSTIFFTSCSIKNSDDKKTSSNILEENTPGEIGKKEFGQDEVVEKMDTIKKKLALKGMILKGDIHLENKEYTTALANYLQIYRDIPSDDSIKNKIGDTYFYIKKYVQALKYYDKISNPQTIDSYRYIFALLAQERLSNEEIPGIKSKILELKLPPQENFYYQNSLTCVENFILCKQNYVDFFLELEETNKEIQESGTGKIIPMLGELENIQKAMVNYDNFQIDDESYKNALITGAFFENSLYPIAINIALNILEKQSDYRPMLKIVAKSYYEMGYYVDAKQYLLKYNTLGDKEAEMSYFLGVVYERLNEYILSTIHLKKALELGYDNPIDIRRRLVYDYYKLDETDKMLAIFNAEVELNLEDMSPNDLNLSIYYHILNDKMEFAENTTHIALEKFPEDETFLGYKAWILIQQAQELIDKSKEENKNNLKSNQTLSGSLENGESEEKIEPFENPKEKQIQEILIQAEIDLKAALEINQKNPMINLIFGKLEEVKGNNRIAFIYFKKTISIDKNGDFGIIAREELDRLQNKK